MERKCNEWVGGGFQNRFFNDSSSYMPLTVCHLYFHLKDYPAEKSGEETWHYYFRFIPVIITRTIIYYPIIQIYNASTKGVFGFAQVEVFMLGAMHR